MLLDCAARTGQLDEQVKRQVQGLQHAKDWMQAFLASSLHLLTQPCSLCVGCPAAHVWQGLDAVVMQVGVDLFSSPQGMAKGLEAACQVEPHQL